MINKKCMDMLDNIIKKNNDRKECTDITEMYKSFSEQMDDFEKFIPEFFSKEGEAENIRNMYSCIRENDYTGISIPCIDINLSHHIYEEYNRGMVQFVNDVISEGSTSSIDYSDKIGRAIANDLLFIESIFGGENNAPKDEPIKEAVRNMETLIDFVPEITTYKSQCERIVESAKECGKVDDNLTTDIIRLLFESVANYCHKTISNIITIYAQVNTSIQPNQPSEKLEDPVHCVF